LPRTPHNAHATTSIASAEVERDVIASLDHDPELYVPGTLTTLPGSRTVTWQTACSTRCPHPDRRCHRAHAVWVDHDPTHALLASDLRASHAQAGSRPRVPHQRRVSGHS